MEIRKPPWVQSIHNKTRATSYTRKKRVDTTGPVIFCLFKQNKTASDCQWLFHGNIQSRKITKNKSFVKTHMRVWQLIPKLKIILFSLEEKIYYQGSCILGSRSYWKRSNSVILTQGLNFNNVTIFWSWLYYINLYISPIYLNWGRCYGLSGKKILIIIFSLDSYFNCFKQMMMKKHLLQ